LAFCRKFCEEKKYIAIYKCIAIGISVYAKWFVAIFPDNVIFLEKSSLSIKQLFRLSENGVKMLQKFK